MNKHPVPWTKVRCCMLESTGQERHYIELPGARIVAIIFPDGTGDMSATYSHYVHLDVLGMVDTEVRYRVLRVAIGSAAEQGLISDSEFRCALIALANAKCRLDNPKSRIVMRIGGR